MGVVEAIVLRQYACAIHFPAGAADGSVIVGVICNGRQAGGGQMLVPGACIDDGLPHAVLLRSSLEKVPAMIPPRRGVDRDEARVAVSAITAPA